MFSIVNAEVKFRDIRLYLGKYGAHMKKNVFFGETKNVCDYSQYNQMP